MDLVNFGAFLLASLVIIAIPGPDFMLLLSHTLGYGARTGLWFAMGLALGNLWHTLLLLLGLATLLQWYPGLLQALKIAGAAYLLYLVYITWRSQPDNTGGLPQVEAGRGWLYLRRGLLCNALNPKVLLFFSAFLPQFIVVDSASSATTQIAFLGLVFILLVMLVYGSVALLMAKLLSQHLGILHSRLGKSLISLVFVYLALRLLWV